MCRRNRRRKSWDSDSDSDDDDDEPQILPERIDEIVEKLYEFVQTLNKRRQYNLKYSNHNDTIQDEFLHFLKPTYREYKYLIFQRGYRDDNYKEMIRYVLSVKMLIPRHERLSFGKNRRRKVENYSDISSSELPSELQKMKKMKLLVNIL